ncbi:MAG: hypothetical protein AAF726_19345, partial [Planctomycetota bacterium]
HSTLVFAAALGLTGAASAQGSGVSIYMDVGSTTFGLGLPSSSFAAAASDPGVWNGIDPDGIPGNVYTSPPLLDTSGAPTAVTLEWDGMGMPPITREDDEINTTGDDEALLDDYGYNVGPSVVTIFDLPPGFYDVLTYAMAPDDPTFQTNVSVLGSSDPLQVVGGDFSGGYVLGVTHALHTVFASPTDPLTIVIDVATDFDTLNGIQLVPSTSGGLGTNYCGPAVPNSSGQSAFIQAVGSDVAADNDLTLLCSFMPTNSFAFFLTSPDASFVMNPGGSQGNLCLGGSIGRYVGPGEIKNSGTLGSISLTIDLTAVPSPTGPMAAVSGDTLRFQTWFRDSVAGSATSNFSNGVELTLQ